MSEQLLEPPVELVEAIRKRDVKFLARYLFPNVRAAQRLAPMQAYIVRRIAFGESRRLSISAYTRYGKTQAVAIGIAIYILLNENKSIAFIGPKEEQAGILRDYMSELVVDCELLREMADFGTDSIERLKKETSKKRLTFKNGCDYRIFSAEGKAERVMGHGADIVVLDEAALITRVAYAKITRMLGDDPENSILIELFNPWERDTKAFDHHISSRFERIQIDWRIGVKEGRTTEAYIAEQAEEYGGWNSLEFIVLYESRFPAQSEDSLHNLDHVEMAENNHFPFEEELQEIEKKLNEPHKYREHEIAAAKEELKLYTRIVSCDPADKGKDETVMYWGIEKEGQFQLEGYWSEPKSESMNLTGKIFQKAREYIGKKVQGRINVDVIGLGTGPVSRLKELVYSGYSNISVVGCHYGEAPSTKVKRKKGQEFVNKKAENNWRLRDLFAEECIGILKIQKLKTQLLAMKWEITSAEKKKIIDPDDYSPDWSDALVYFVWKDRSAMAFDFV